MKKNRVYLWETIYNKIEKAHGKSICFDIDVRYLDKWLTQYPQCFPKFMLEKNFTVFFNGDLLRYEIKKGIHKVEFNAKDLISNHWNHWKQLQDLKAKIHDQLALRHIVKENRLLFFVKFSDLKDSWAPKDLLLQTNQGNEEKNHNLQALADKLCYMIDKGRSDDIKPMLVSICKNTIKAHQRPHYNNISKRRNIYNENETFCNEFIGHGHFRWNFKVYTLSDIEIERVKEFFHIK